MADLCSTNQAMGKLEGCNESSTNCELFSIKSTFFFPYSVSLLRHILSLTTRQIAATHKVSANLTNYSFYLLLVSFYTILPKFSFLYSQFDVVGYIKL
jgi:hypothetical protein